ncbi:MAG: TPM domain-containing protein [Oscillospiraceae bacterium]|nr:TPM domain-containing protein [Oscillospiraceae bacterium]MBQ1899356.1 TPM domain-containing protein [Erysipelotrichaceae bacterium]
MAKKKKKEKKTLIEKLALVPRRTWRYVFFAALAVMLIPILIDMVIPESRFDSTVVPEKDLIVIRDDADLLTDEEEQSLYERMIPVTKYGGAAFYTSDYVPGSTSDYARDRYRENFGKKSGTIFVIDMDNRYIYIFSDGRIYDTVTKAKAETITDNVYMYARRAEYFECAARAFDQIATILDGNRIPQPMKHISNALLSLAFSLITVFIVANARTRMKKDDEMQVYSDMVRRRFSVGSVTQSALIETKRSRHYEGSSGGGGGFSGGGSSGGGGGGGSSGGGGGHGF